MPNLQPIKDFKKVKKRLMEKRPYSPTKEEIAAMKVLEEAGYSMRAISRSLNRNFKTVKLYLHDHIELYEDPEIKKLIDKLREIEYDDLETLNFKAKRALHERFDKGVPPTIIEATAVMDRTWQQKEALRKEMGREIDPEKVMVKIADKKKEIEDLDVELEEISKKYAR